MFDEKKDSEPIILRHLEINNEEKRMLRMNGNIMILK
jgi:hypothetical protein